MKSHNTIFSLLLLSLCFFCFTSKGLAQSLQASNDSKIVVISSYSSDTKYNYESIRNCANIYSNLGGTCDIIVENMNEFALSHPDEWVETFEKLVNKHDDIALLLLLGGEAWSGYLYSNNEQIKSIPAICTTASRFGFSFPGEGEDMLTYTPTSVDYLELMKNSNVKACYAYEYDIDGNFELAKSFFPNSNHIAIISDNTYSGLAQQAQFTSWLEKHPEVTGTIIDGRKFLLEEASKITSSLPENSVLFMGIWRIDKNLMYFYDNASYIFRTSNPTLPVFSLTSTAIGYWAIGGLVPDYDGITPHVAQKIFDILHTSKPIEQELTSLSHFYKFDNKKLIEFDLQDTILPENSIVINKKLSFWKTYQTQLEIIIFIIILLILALCITSYYYFRMRSLKNDLQFLATQLQEDKISLMQSERDLRIAKDNAEKASQMKSAFVSNISHEVRTPLNAIVGFSSLLVDNQNTKEEQEEYAKIIQTNSDLLLQLINDVLDLSRLESNKSPLVYEKCDLVSLCSTMTLLINHQHPDEAQVSFKNQYSSMELNTDPLKLQQVITNLLNNSIKFTPKTGNITLTFEKVEKDKEILFSVTDNGIGISPEKQELVFERFEKLNEFAQGTGLGLPICREIIEKMGGKIWVDGSYKKGARFIFSHPL